VLAFLRFSVSNEIHGRERGVSALPSLAPSAAHPERLIANDVGVARLAGPLSQRACSTALMTAFGRVKDTLAAMATLKGPRRSSERSQDSAECLHITMASSSSDTARSSGRRSGASQSSRQPQRSGAGQPSGAQRSGLQKKAGGSVSWFGVPLDIQQCELDRGRRVPKLLAALRRAMNEQGGLDQEGIFRESPDRRLLSFIRQRLEAGEDPDAVLEGCSSEIIGALIKAWFGELPGGVWVGGELDPKAKKGSKKGADASGKELETQLLAAAQCGMPMAMLLKQGLPPGQREVRGPTHARACHRPPAHARHPRLTGLSELRRFVPGLPAYGSPDRYATPTLHRTPCPPYDLATSHTIQRPRMTARLVRRRCCGCWTC